MAQPYVGEIRMFAGNFAPNGWMFCEGQTLPISENDVLFQLIGTTYGGDGEETFNLPNLASRVPMHMGTGPDGTTYQIGEMAGTEQETLTMQQIPSHTHPLVGFAATTRGRRRPPGNVLATAHGDRTCTGRGLARRTAWLPTSMQSGRRQPAAREHAAVPLHQLHHLPVRGLPEPDLRRAPPCPISSLRRSASSRSTSRPPGGRSATGS